MGVEAIRAIARASGDALAAALVEGELATVEPLFSRDVSLWATRGEVYSTYTGRAETLRALRRLLAAARPTRVRVLACAVDAVVLAAFAGDDALWSIELNLDPERVDAVMVWLPVNAVADLDRGGRA